MRLEDFHNRLNTLGIPVAYRRFKSKPSLPFVCYYVSDEDIYGSDFENLILSQDIKIELYTDKKDIEIEEKINELFHDFELNKSEMYIADEDLFEVMYSLTNIHKL